MKIKKNILLFLIIIMTFGMIGCSSNKNAMMSYGENASYDMETTAVSVSQSTTMNSGIDGKEVKTSDIITNEKLIKNIQITMESKEYETTVLLLEQLVFDMGGYIQTSNVPRNPEGEKYSGLSANFSFMIPTDKVEVFVSSTGGLGSVINTSRSVENVTDAYMDTETHIKNLELKEKRLLELLEQSGSLKDLIEIENNISDTRYEIERYKSTIKNYDKRIAYTSVSVSVSEVYTYTPKSEKQTLWQRISNEFNNSLEDFKYGMEGLFVWIIGVLPFVIIRLILLLIPVGIVLLILKKIKHKYNKKPFKKTKEDEEKK